MILSSSVSIQLPWLGQRKSDQAGEVQLVEQSTDDPYFKYLNPANMTWTYKVICYWEDEVQ